MLSPPPKIPRCPFRWVAPWGGLSLAVVGLDQAVKAWVLDAMLPGQSWALWPEVFHLTLAWNTGSAFSLGASQPGVMAAISVAVLLGLLTWAWRQPPATPLGVWGLGAVVGGALGNLIDRLRFGAVLDYLDVRAIHYPIFNLADSAVVLGVLALVWSYVRHPADADR